MFATGNPPLTSSAQMHRCQMLTLQRMESTCKMFLSLSMLCCAYDVFGTLQFSFPHLSMSTCSLFTFHDRSMSHSARVTTQCHPLIFWQKISANTFLHTTKSSNILCGFAIVSQFFLDACIQSFKGLRKNLFAIDAMVGEKGSYPQCVKGVGRGFASIACLSLDFYPSLKYLLCAIYLCFTPLQYSLNRSASSRFDEKRC